MKLDKIKIGKLNILDLTIMGVVILFVAIFAVSRLDNSTENVEQVSANTLAVFSYTISIGSLSNTSADMFRIGDEVYDKVSNVYIGKIKSLDITEAKGLVDKENGEIIQSTIPGKIDVKLGIETNGVVKNGEYLANNLIRIMVGNSKEIKTKYIMCIGTISDIEK